MSELSKQRALSFGSVSDAYDRYRPGPAPAALDWLLPADARAVLDLGAGTGALTRLLVDRVDTVTAVEPDERMREVLGRRATRATVLAGVAEALPVPDASQDAVLASASWHWVDPARAVPQVRRVLRPGGRLGIVWTSFDREVEWVERLWRRLRAYEGARGTGPASGETAHAPGRGPRELTLPDGSAFGPVEGPHEECYARRFTIEQLVGLAGTYSALIVQDQEGRDAFLEVLRRDLAADERFAEHDHLEIPLRSRCWRADAV